MVLPKVRRNTTRGDSSALLRRFSASIAVLVICFVGYIEYTLFEIDNETINRGAPSSAGTQQEELKIYNNNNDNEGLDYHEKEREWHKHTIPHVIWQTSRSKVLPPEANRTVSTWRQLNPDYDYQLMDDMDVDNFFRTKFSSRIYKAFKMLPLGVMRADMWRVAIIYYYGGIYGDLDSIAVRPIDKWLTRPDCDAYIGIESRTQFCNWAFAAVPKHPVFKQALDTIVEKLEQDGGVHPDHAYFVHDYTGPLIFTKAIQRTLQANTTIADDIMKDAVALDNAKKVRLCLFEQNFFSRKNVMNSYASLHWNNSKHWGRWVHEKNAFVKDYQKNQTKKNHLQ